VRICDPFRAAGWFFLVAERHFELQCPCGVTQRADALRTRDSGDVTLYECKHCDRRLIGVADDDRGPVEGPIPPDDPDGHRMMGYVFGSKVDMSLWPPAAVEPWMSIPARPGFFTKRGCE